MPKNLYGKANSLFLTVAFLAMAMPASGHERPLGDGKYSSEPKVGYLMSCQTRFNPNAPGSSKTGPWVGATTFDPEKKPSVDGSVTWPSEISIERKGSSRIVRSNNLPDHPTGVFPIARSDVAYEYDRNPNPIRPQDILLTLPADPVIAGTPNCVPMGMIGVALTGAVFYNALDARGRDAPAYEMQDDCSGHPQRTGQYHYHDRSPCFQDTRSQPGGHSDLVGYGLDGFGIFGLYGEGGQKLTTSDLDGCHGHTHEVIWDGDRKEIYHYHVTDEYPYSIGCYRGTPVETRAMRGGMRDGQPGQRRPQGAPPHGHRPPPPFKN